MKRLLIISYWVVSILLVALVLISLGYRFLEALFIGILFLPGALAAKFFFSKVNFKKQRSAVKDIIFVVLGILVGEMFLFLVAHYYINLLREGRIIPSDLIPDIPQIGRAHV